MRIKVLIDSLGAILMLFGLSFLVPIVTGMVYHESYIDLFLSFGIPLIITLLLGWGMRNLSKGDLSSLRDREGFAVVAIGWLSIAALGSLPFMFSGTLTSPADAFFESMSGFTTTGSTVLEAPSGIDYLEIYPHSILMWRSFIQWVGGMGIIVLSVVVLSRILGGGMQLLQAEVPGPSVTRLAPKLAQTARILWTLYLGFTIMEIILLVVAGVTPFGAVCHSFTTLATGGFSPHSASIYHHTIANYDHPIWIEAIIITFMFIAGGNFVLWYYATKGKVRRLLKDPEFQAYFFIIALGTILITADLAFHDVYGVGASFRHSIFAVVSVMTTTGYSTVQFGIWPSSSLYVLLFLMFIGGMAASTAGGIKVIRILILVKLGRREVEKAIHPRAVIPVRLANKPVPEKVVTSICLFTFLYAGIFLFATLVLATAGHDLRTAVSSVAATLNNVGPGFGMVSPDRTFAFYSGWEKVFLSLLMWLGRLEILTGILIFFPSAWRD